MKKIFLLLPFIAALFACGPEAGDEAPAASTNSSSQASIVYCQPASWCAQGARPLYFPGYMNLSWPKCNAAIAAGTCTGNSAGQCWYSALTPPGCYPR